MGVPGFGQCFTAYPSFSFLRRCRRVWEEHHRQTDEVSGPCTVAAADTTQTSATGSETGGGWGKLPISVAAEHGWGAAPWSAPQRADLACVSPLPQDHP